MSLWETASEQIEVEAHLERLTACRVALASTVAFLAQAEHEAEFEHRRALVADKIDRIVGSVADGADFATLRSDVEASLKDDWDVAHRARVTAAQRVQQETNARRAFLRNEARARQRVAATIQRRADFTEGVDCPGSGDFVKGADGGAKAKCPKCGQEVPTSAASGRFYDDDDDGYTGGYLFTHLLPGKRKEERTSSVRHTAPGGGVHAPYNIEQRDGKWVVVNDLGEVKGTHDSEEEARQQQKALYANVEGASEMAERKHEGARDPNLGRYDCPTCKRKDVLTEDEAKKGYQCKQCARRDEGGDFGDGMGAWGSLQTEARVCSPCTNGNHSGTNGTPGCSSKSCSCPCGRKGKNEFKGSKTAVTLTNVSFDGDMQGNVAKGTDPNGKVVKFRLSDKDAKDLRYVLTSDLAINFSGVTVGEDEIISEGSKEASDDGSYDCPKCYGHTIMRGDGTLECRECGWTGTKADWHDISDKKAASLQAVAFEDGDKCNKCDQALHWDGANTVGPDGKTSCPEGGSHAYGAKPGEGQDSGEWYEQHGKAAFRTLGSERYDTAKKVLEQGIYSGPGGSIAKIDGAMLDAVTASMLVALYEALSPENQVKFDSIPIDKLVDFGWSKASSLKVEANPYMDQNPYGSGAPGQRRQPPTGTPDEMLDGPERPPMNDQPRRRPNGMPGEFSGPVGKDASLIPLICHACGQTGNAPLEKISATMRCACGSDDLDVHEAALEVEADGSKEAAGSGISGDLPFDQVAPFDEQKRVQQDVRCSNCLQDFVAEVDDPAQPLPNCPNCGSSSVSAAGAGSGVSTATLTTPGTWYYVANQSGTTWTAPPATSSASNATFTLNFTSKTASDDLGGGGGFLSWLQTMWHQMKAGGGEIPSWFPKRLLLPEEIESGRFVGGGGSVHNFNHAAKAQVCPNCGDEMNPGLDGHYCRKTNQYVPHNSRGAAHAKVLEIAEGVLSTNAAMQPEQALAIAMQTVQRFPRVAQRKEAVNWKEQDQVQFEGGSYDGKRGYVWWANPQENIYEVRCEDGTVAVIERNGKTDGGGKAVPAKPRPYMGELPPSANGNASGVW